MAGYKYSKEFIHCSKNPTHENFFDTEEMPEFQEFLKNFGINFIGLSDLLAQQIKRTCRIIIEPKTSPHIISGTGYIYKISETEKILCQCLSCVNSLSFAVGELYVRTALHLIEDLNDISAVTIKLFDDVIVSQSFTTRAIRYEKTFEGDTVILVCTVCKPYLLNIFKNSLMNYKKLYALVKHENLNHISPVAIIISYPHGDTMLISAGKVNVQFSAMSSENFIVKYDTPTCPGTSGADVLILGGGFPSVIHVGGNVIHEKQSNFGHIFREVETKSSNNLPFSILSRLYNRLF